MKREQPARKRLAALKKQLKTAAARDAPKDDSQAEARGRALGLAFRIITDLIAAPIVGGGLGWLLDRWTGLNPLFLIIFFFLGLAAGVINVMRTAQEMNQNKGDQ